METLLIVFIVVTAVAVVIQTGILIALFATFRKSVAHMEALATDVHSRAIPTLEAAQSMIAEYRPRLDTALDNLVSTTTLVRQQVSSLEEPVADAVERARMQVVRVDELMTRTLDRVEDTTELVHQSIITPVRRISGVMQGITAGLATLLGHSAFSRDRRPASMPKDEMFI